MRGASGAVGTAPIPIEGNTASKSGGELRDPVADEVGQSMSGVEQFARAIYTVPAPGCSVTPSSRTCRVPSSMTKATSAD